MVVDSGFVLFGGVSAVVWFDLRFDLKVVGWFVGWLVAVIHQGLLIHFWLIFFITMCLRVDTNS